MSELETPVQSEADLLIELGVVRSTLAAAINDRSRIEREIRQTRDIETLAALHDEWQEAIELQAAASDRAKELEAMVEASE